jgi:CheY-like chemotaxis protein
MSVSPILKETARLLRASIPANIDITPTITATSDTVLASPTGIQQIIMNLAVNASLAMAEEGSSLEISLTDIEFRPDSPDMPQDLKPGEYLQLTVKDNGTGMSPEVKERIFEPFFTTREQGKGTGLGLSVVYGIVKSLEGAITVESELGVGSTFRVFFPKIKTEARPEILQSSELPRGDERILFVEDEEVLVEWGQVVLERLGYTVTAVNSSTKGLRVFSADPSLFDLVITDQAMPKMTGAQLSKQILEIRKDIPIILCTGHSETVSPDMAKEMGIREFLMKPLTRQELAQAIRRVLDAKKSV